ncbi:hypothetical protein CCUS01_10571 [Colletotrichum cuscutae]|uniref:Uncharacterized protein n=1 Tax=Colletotrichum cuscutae TaxID=1209917 RepID=A0AAI9U9L2_9PEZI|nr:hypothetical protein CCUS01_10571 [Colletotrichum cuscutae]
MRLCNRSGGRTQMSGEIPTQYFLLRALCPSRLAPLASDMDLYGTTDTATSYICLWLNRVLDSHHDSNKSAMCPSRRSPTNPLTLPYQSEPGTHTSVLKYLPIRILRTPHPHPRSKGPDQTLKPVRNCDSLSTRGIHFVSVSVGLSTPPSNFLRRRQKMVSTPALSPTLLFDETPWYCAQNTLHIGTFVGGYILGTAGDIRIALTSGHPFCPDPSTLYNLSSGDSNLPPAGTQNIPHPRKPADPPKRLISRPHMYLQARYMDAPFGCRSDMQSKLLRLNISLRSLNAARFQSKLKEAMESISLSIKLEDGEIEFIYKVIDKLWVATPQTMISFKRCNCGIAALSFDRISHPHRPWPVSHDDAKQAPIFRLSTRCHSFLKLSGPVWIGLRPEATRPCAYHRAPPNPCFRRYSKRAHPDYLQADTGTSCTHVNWWTLTFPFLLYDIFNRLIPSGLANLTRLGSQIHLSLASSFKNEAILWTALLRRYEECIATTYPNEILAPIQ